MPVTAEHIFPMEDRTPYRLNVAAFGLKRGRTYKKYSKLEPYDYGFMGWTENQVFDAGARLPNDGSFLFAGMTEARRAAMEYLAQPTTRQVSIRTNQDRRVYVYNKHTDGRITGYSCIGD